MKSRRSTGQRTTNDTTVPDQGATVNTNHQQPAITPVIQLKDQESVDFLLYRLQTMTGKAREAYERADAASKRAAGYEQTITKLDTVKQEVLAKLDQIERERAAAASSAKDAYAERDGHMAEHETFARRAEDASRLCRASGISTEQGLPVPPTAPVPLPQISDDARLDGPMSRFNGAHDEEGQQDPQAGAA